MFRRGPTPPRPHLLSRACASPTTARCSISAGVQEMGQGARNAVAAIVAAYSAFRRRRSRRSSATPRARRRISLLDRGARRRPCLPRGKLRSTCSTRCAGSAPIRVSAADESATPRQILRAAGRPYLEVEARHRAPGQPEAVFDRLAQGQLAFAGPEYPEFVSFSYIAHFVEVRVEPNTRRVRVPRVVSVADCGRVMSPRTARNQVIGGVVWGIGAALREASEVEPRYGGFLNADLAEYVIPVNADIGDIQVDFVDEPDLLLNDAGVKGLGEVAIVGVAAAVANAVHHATGRRIRKIPIRIEDLL